MSKPKVSLCIPTNGVVEWVFPVLDSVLKQNCDKNLYEVIITDNGDNLEFKKKIKEYTNVYSNIIYAETNAPLFLNEIESYKRASGELIKFVNHRTMLVDGALQKLITFAQQNGREKPIVYFSNGVLNISENKHELKTFDEFVRMLSYFSSWSTGMAIWKTDFHEISTNIEAFNELFPHTTILFAERNRSKYVIDNTVIFDEIPQGKKPKGKYDLFYAFGVEYPGIILDLLREKCISFRTYKSVINDNRYFVSILYFSYIIRKQYCSYDLSGLENMYGVFYSHGQLLRGIFKWFWKQAVNKMRRIMRK